MTNKGAALELYALYNVETRAFIRNLWAAEWERYLELAEHPGDAVDGWEFGLNCAVRARVRRTVRRGDRIFSANGMGRVSAVERDRVRVEYEARDRREFWEPVVSCWF